MIVDSIVIGLLTVFIALCVLNAIDNFLSKNQ